MIGTAALAVFSRTPWSAVAGYPDKPIRFIVPVSPGGGSDLLARTIGIKLSEILGQSVIVDNRPGASGNIGAEIVAKSSPDGYTIVIETTVLITAPMLYRAVPFDPSKDFAPITLAARVPHVLVVNPKLQATSLMEFIVLVRSRPAALNYSSAGKGSPIHLAAELFKSRAHLDIVHVPYAGGGPANAAVIGGQVDLTFGNITAVLPHIRAGRLRALGITSVKRSSAAPDIPPIAEAGVPDYDFSSWFGILAPARTPRPIIDRLNAGFIRVVNLPEIKDRLGNDGTELATSSPEEFAAYLQSETRKWARVLKEAGIKAD
jgi:tripartite-type tricarboxylate transporter receptor subunit TctC